MARRTQTECQNQAIDVVRGGEECLTTSCPEAYTRLPSGDSSRGFNQSAHHQVLQDVKETTYAKVKLPTFCTAATALPLTVMLVKGVSCRVLLPYQSMASTDACPPSQLQLFGLRRYV